MPVTGVRGGQDITWYLGYLLVSALILCACPGAGRADVFRDFDKVIWIDQEQQYGVAYAHGRDLLAFPILSGDDETPTPPGTYVIRLKDKHYYSRKFDTPMPYSLFFDLKGMRAIHEGAVPGPREIEQWATHGCIHVEEPYMKWLYDWAEQGKTVVVIEGQRIGPGEEPQEGQYEAE